MTPRGHQHQIGIDVDLGQGGDARPLEETPFRVAVLADFSGRASRGLLGSSDEIAGRAPMQVDRDDLDQAIAEMAPELHLSLEGDQSPRITVRFASLDDFHPDQLLDRVPLLKEMGALRKRLADPRTFAAAASELARNPGQLPLGPSAPPDSSADAEEFKVHHPTEGAGLLDAILGEGPAAAAEPGHAESAGDLHAFIQKVIRSHIVPRPDPRQADLLAEVDAALSEMMRKVLHHPDFLALEAAWRGVDRLVRRVDTSSELQIHLIDLSAAELRLDLSNRSAPSPSGLERLFSDTSVEWSFLAGLYTFGPDDEDLRQLGWLGAVGRANGAPWISAATPSLVGASSLLESTDPRDWNPEPPRFWNPLRQSAEAGYLGLALPRYLVRLPYGKKTEACERFPFEEWIQGSDHGDYCWGNPALLVAELHAVAFAEHGWRMTGQIGVEVDHLPLHLRGGDESTPVAEVLLPVKAADTIQERGVMALASLKGDEAARFGRLQSIAEPLAALAGRWQRAG